MKAELNFAGYANYGSYSSTLKLLISEDYNGDVTAANWVEVSFERLPITTKSQNRKVDMSQFDGKIVTIALRHESRITDEFPLTELKTAHILSNFEVSAIRKIEMMMRIGQKKYTHRMVPVLLLVAFLSSGFVSTFAKDKTKGKTVLFEDGWQELKPVEGENQTGNFTAISLKGEPEQSDNKKWLSSWGNWSVNGTDGESKRGVIMIPNKLENDDWLISEEINLNDCKKPELNIEAYSKYGTDTGNDLEVLISKNYNGDLESVNWDELYVESFHKQNQAQLRCINLKKYIGKKVVVAFRSIHKGKSLKNLTRTTFLSKVTVIAVKK